MNEEKIEEYRSALVAVHIAAQVLRAHDLPKLLNAIEHADAFGPLLDPTLWRDKRRAMDEDKKCIEAALPLWRLGERLVGDAP